jgi:hypothetical protein
MNGNAPGQIQGNMPQRLCRNLNTIFCVLDDILPEHRSGTKWLEKIQRVAYAKNTELHTKGRCLLFRCLLRKGTESKQLTKKSDINRDNTSS